MKTIDIDDEVYQALEKRAIGFNLNPNEVIKRLLASQPKVEAQQDHSPTANGQISPIVELVQSSEYLRGVAKDRYFNILHFLYRADQSQFERLNGFRAGSRVQISKNKQEIENSGVSTQPQQLVGTPFWVSSNLSNGRKRAILEILLRDFRYTDDIIRIVLRTIPDSGIRRSSRLELYT